MGQHGHLKYHITWIALMDVLCLLLGIAFGVFIRFGREEVLEHLSLHAPGWIIFCGSIILANYLAGNYQLQTTFSRFNMVIGWLFSIFFAIMILSVSSYALFQLLQGRGVLLLAVSGYSALSLVLKLLFYRRLFRSENFVCRVIIVGAGKTAFKIKQMVEGEYIMPAHRVVAMLNVIETKAGEPAVIRKQGTSVVVDCGFFDVETLADYNNFGAELLVIALDDHEMIHQLYPALRKIRFSGVEIMTELNVAETYGGYTPLEALDEELVTDLILETRIPFAQRGKRVFDICCSLAGSVLLMPLMLMVALLIKLFDRSGPVFYTQWRTGLFGRPFKILKFRTMPPGAEDETGAVWSVDNDPRVTKLGRFLRRTRLDELPQLINVIRGDMSMVGPRPERPEFNATLENEIPFYNERTNVLPGLTGWAQIRYPYGNSIDDARRKLEYDLYYIKHLSVALDCQILLSTLRIMLFGYELKKRSVSDGPARAVFSG